MTESRQEWSPADNPYAIAVSEAQWALRTVQLAVLRLGDPDDRRLSWCSSRQIDARQLVVALSHLLTAETLEQRSLQALGIDAKIGENLTRAREDFEDKLPGLKYMRDALVHFDEWALGQGRGPQKAKVKAGAPRREVATEYWGFGYEPSAATISLGPYMIHVEAAAAGAIALSRAIFMAAHAVDQRDAAALRRKVIDALQTAGIVCDSTDSPLTVSPRPDLGIWLSLRVESLAAVADKQSLARHVIGALESEGLEAIAPAYPAEQDPVERLTRGEAVQVTGTRGA